MIGVKIPLYQTCKKCGHQSDIPQTSDCLFRIWEACPECGSGEWDLEEGFLLHKLKEFFVIE